jgi:hypothetical protein
LPDDPEPLPGVPPLALAVPEALAAATEGRLVPQPDGIVKAATTANARRKC